MNAQISSSTLSHADIALLLPWYVNQSLAFNESQQVEAHLKSCLICRRELVNLRKLSSAVQRSTDLDVAAEASFAGLRAKMQSAEQSRQAPAPWSGTAKHWLGQRGRVDNGLFANRRRFWIVSGNSGKGLAIAASLLLVMVPAAMTYLPLSAMSQYYTLSSAKPDASPVGELRVVFARHVAEKEIDAALRQIDAVRVDGPNSVGAYTVKLGAGGQNQAAALGMLRGRQDVILAEPILQP